MVLSKILLSFCILISLKATAGLNDPVFVDDVAIFPIADFRCIEVLPLSVEGYFIDFSHHGGMSCFYVGEKSIKFNNSEPLTEQSIRSLLEGQKNLLIGLERHFSLKSLEALLSETDNKIVRYTYLSAYLKEKKLTYPQFIQLLTNFPDNKDYVGVLVGRMLRPKNQDLIMWEMLKYNYPLSDELKIVWLRILKLNVEKKLAIAWVHSMQDIEAKKTALNYLPPGIILAQGEKAKDQFLQLLSQYGSDNLDQFLTAYCATKTKKKKVASRLNRLWHSKK